MCIVTKDQPDGSVPALTALPRPEWAKIRKEYFSESLNQQSLEAIEESMFLVRQHKTMYCKWFPYFLNLDDVLALKVCLFYVLDRRSVLI